MILHEDGNMQHNDGDGQHDDGVTRRGGTTPATRGDSWHDDGDGQHDNGDGQQGNRRHDDGDRRHDNCKSYCSCTLGKWICWYFILTFLKFLCKYQFWCLILNLVKMAATVTNVLI